MKIVSQNINGLCNPVKRGKVLAKIKKEKSQVIFLQETHLSQQEHEKLKKFGFRNTYYSSFKKGHRRGVAILIPLNSVCFEFCKEISDKEGRYILVRGKIENKMVTLVNVYAPPDCSKSFFKSLFNVVAQEMEGVLVLGGDFNVVINSRLDTTSHCNRKRQISKCVRNLLEDLGLIDAWRDIHPLTRDYTHYSAPHKVHSRIDYLFNK